jgi:hypothetical protein
MATVQGWGRQTWNSGAWNTFAPVAATGNGLTSSLGSSTLTGDCNITLTGIGTTSTTGTAVATGVAVATATGNAITSTLGTETVTGSSTHTLTGIGTTASLGDETATGVAQSGWNRGVAGDSEVTIGWNDNLWNTTAQSYSFTGTEGTSSVGQAVGTTDFNITVTGLGLTSGAGQIGGSIEAGSLGLTSSIGTFSISGDSQLTVVAASEPELDINIGTAAVEIGKTAFPSGNAITSSLGSVTVVGTSVVSPSGVNLTGSLGTEVASTDVNIIGTGGFVTKTVTVVSTDSGNKYVIDGVQQETLELVEGVTYRFDQADASNDGHPFRFSETENGSHGGGSEYTTGVTTNGTPGNAGAYTQITVAASAPTLYYYCTVHSAMGGQANTPTASAGTNIFTANGLTVSLGEVSETVTAGATVAATGNALTASLGDETQETSYALTGTSATFSLGTLTITGTSTLTLTGVSVTSSTGTLQGTFWSEVDDSNSDISWTEVHQAA